MTKYLLVCTMYRISLFVALIAAVSAAKHDIYKGYTVHGIKIHDQSEQDLVHILEETFDVDFWQDGWPGARDAIFMVSPQNRMDVLQQLEKDQLTHYLIEADIVKALETHDEQIEEWTRSRNGRQEAFEIFPRYDEINAYLERVAAEYPDLVTLVNGGQSFEGRDIKYVKISTTNFTDASKPIYFMEAMLHAREWVTTPVTLFSIHRLVENLRTEDQDLLEDVDWIILPLANPDGYEYTFTDERLWRRTRSFNPEVSTECYGADANRNFDVNWNTTTGVSSNPCNNQYVGYEAFSEPETRIVRDIMLEHADRIQLFMDIHSYGSLMLFGFGNTTLPANGVHLFHVGAVFGATVDALRLPAGDLYLVGNSALSLYSTSGSAQDYGQYVGVPLSYTLELPHYGYFFQVPPEFIGQINYETWEGIAATARLARSYYRARLSN